MSDGPSGEAVALWRFFWTRCQNLHSDRQPPLAVIDDAPSDIQAEWKAEEALRAAYDRGRQDAFVDMGDKLIAAIGGGSDGR